MNPTEPLLPHLPSLYHHHMSSFQTDVTIMGTFFLPVTRPMQRHFFFQRYHRNWYIFPSSHACDGGDLPSLQWHQCHRGIFFLPMTALMQEHLSFQWNQHRHIFIYKDTTDPGAYFTRVTPLAQTFLSASNLMDAGTFFLSLTSLIHGNFFFQWHNKFRGILPSMDTTKRHRSRTFFFLSMTPPMQRYTFILVTPLLQRFFFLPLKPPTHGQFSLKWNHGWKGIFTPRLLGQHLERVQFHPLSQETQQSVSIKTGHFHHGLSCNVSFTMVGALQGTRGVLRFLQVGMLG